MTSLEVSFNNNGHFSEEEISSYFVDPNMLVQVQEIILGSTDPAFRKACMLAIIDNTSDTDQVQGKVWEGFPETARAINIKKILDHPDLRADLQALLDDLRESSSASVVEESDSMEDSLFDDIDTGSYFVRSLLSTIETHLQNIRDVSPGIEYIKAAESLRDNLLKTIKSLDDLVEQFPDKSQE